MKKTLFISLLVLAFIGLLWMMSARDMNTSSGDLSLPWQINQTAEGDIQVFGLTLGQTTLAQAAGQLNVEPEVALFQTPTRELNLEAYFGRLSIGPLQARLIAYLAADELMKQGFAEHHLDSEARPSGSLRLRLAPDDFNHAMQLPLQYLVYLPIVDIERDNLLARFGQPAEILPSEQNSEIWLYPAVGLVIRWFPDDKEVFHYTNPQQLDQLVKKLKNQAIDPAL